MINPTFGDMWSTCVRFRRVNTAAPGAFYTLMTSRVLAIGLCFALVSPVGRAVGQEEDGAEARCPARGGGIVGETDEVDVGAAGDEFALHVGPARRGAFGGDAVGADELGLKGAEFGPESLDGGGGGIG